MHAVLSQIGGDNPILVWDNASSDDTAARVARLGVPVHICERNIGYAAAHNRLLEQSQSDYVLTLNPDAVIQPGFIAALAAALDADPSAGSASGCLLRVEQIDGAPTGVDSAGLYLRRSRRQGLIAEGRQIAQRPSAPRPIFGADGACAFYRRAMLDDVRVDGEVFDEDFWLHKEDIDLAWRARLRGWSALYVPEAVAHHIRSFRPGSRAPMPAEVRRAAVRNRWLLLLKNEIAACFWRDLPFILAYDAAILAYLLLRERESLAALADVVRLWAKMRHKRHIIQAGRRVGSQEMCAWFRG